ncbi:DUF3489 domain-containing protein [Oricola sp.]|uniref:DUF3489 domain-containing protein n=1 Tax=Oricola sp. TaxID=1979950 RepID=UPI0025F54008|nr:DUF3489 domain-containing protein [Oricola sp.]MCI5078729.1 DUF3489 domain-containing protein [Oricola sp.]
MTQIQLSDAQAVILSTACAREDGAVFPVTANLKGGAVGNVCKSLLKQGLIEEIPATDLNTVYRHDEERGPVTLRATPLAYGTLGITDTPDDDDAAETPPAPPAERRSGTKQEALIAMLRAEGGATIEEIATALSWKSHTVRGAIAGALKKKLGLTITSEKEDQRGRVYRTDDGPSPNAR